MYKKRGNYRKHINMVWWYFLLQLSITLFFIQLNDIRYRYRKYSWNFCLKIHIEKAHSWDENVFIYRIYFTPYFVEYRIVIAFLWTVEGAEKARLELRVNIWKAYTPYIPTDIDIDFVQSNDLIVVIRWLYNFAIFLHTENSYILFDEIFFHRILFIARME